MSLVPGASSILGNEPNKLLCKDVRMFINILHETPSHYKSRIHYVDYFYKVSNHTQIMYYPHDRHF
jgi:hypothetical protein